MLKLIKHFTPGAGLVSMIFCIIMSQEIKAQDVLTGLTSNGGPEGGGTVFSIKATGSNFSIIKGFADWGFTPKGDLYRHTDGNFYGMVSSGGTLNNGTLFKMTPSGAITILRHFDYDNDGAYPTGELIKGPDGNMWGMTVSGGTYTSGTIFKLTTAGVFTVVHEFNYNPDGGSPAGHLVLGKDGNFYGITSTGGASGGYGTIFKMTPAGTYTTLKALNGGTDGGPSYGSITEGADGNLYGMTYGGGTNGIGTIFKIAKNGTGFLVLRNFTYATDGGYSKGDLIQATDGNLYGMTAAGGVNGYGTIFKIKTTGASFTVLRSPTSADGAPAGGLLQLADGFLYGLAYGGGTQGGGTFFKISTAGAFTPLHSFKPDTEGGYPQGGVILSTDGNLYGLTSDGGPNFGGTAFKVTTAGAFTLLASFNGATLGNAPYESLLRGNDSAFYGTTSDAGAKRYYGTIFKICAGNTTVLHTFDNPTGGVPMGSLVQASNGAFYGTTQNGGTNNGGTIFKITKSGTYTVMRHLSGSADGGEPNGSLIQATDGNLYGMNYSGGSNSGGTIFKMTLAGTYTVLRHLNTADGYYPYGSLVQATDGNFYGCTSTGGANSGGTIFKITPGGTFTVLRNLTATPDGANPQGNLVQHPNGSLYGTTSSGGTYGGGTIFKITTGGAFQVIKHLNPTPNGSVPKGSLLIGSDSSFYGLTSDGGTYDAGTIFKITTGGTFTVLRHLNLVTDGGVPYGSLIIFPPNTLVANPQSISTKEETNKNITLTGSGASPLTFNVLATPKHGTLTGTGANRVYKPALNYNGKDSITFNVSFNCINSSPAKINITVTAVADTPVLAPIGNKTVKKDSTLTFTAKATDGDKSETLTFSLIGAPAGASINGSTGVFTWTPASTGSFPCTVRVTDNSALALYDQETITITVMASGPGSGTGADVSEISIYPNPVTTKLIVTLNKPVDKLRAIVTDIRGFELVKSELQLNGRKTFEINVERLNPGAYFLRLQTMDGDKVFSFIKKE